MRIKKGTTRLEAAQEWINGFNAVPTLMIAKLWTADPDDWCEITRPAVGDQVRVFNNITTNGKITTINYEDNLCEIELDNGNLTWLNTDYINIEHDDVLPMWGTMWSFGDICDNYWLDDEIGLTIEFLLRYMQLMPQYITPCFRPNFTTATRYSHYTAFVSVHVMIRAMPHKPSIAV